MSPTRGFTLLEMLICIIIVAAMSLLGSFAARDMSLDHLDFVSGYLQAQAQAFTEKRSVHYENGISFNAAGNVNQGKSIDKGRHRVVIHLGNGYISYE